MVETAIRPECELAGASSFEAFRNDLSQTFVPVCAASGDAKIFRGPSPSPTSGRFASPRSLPTHTSRTGPSD
jgi:hypothetical protein